MKNAKRIEQINEKIAELQKIQKQLENEYLDNVSKDIAKLLFKKKAFNIDKNILIKEIEKVIDGVQKWT